jgi:DNA-binding response OmpR family regulator
MTEPAGTPGDLVLVADDDRDIVRFVEVNLKLEGFRVVTAHDGDDALAKALSLAPDLVLLDVMMPRMDGFEVCSRLRADPRTGHVPVIMLTAKSLSADKVLGLTAGADDYVIKPFDPMELVARVRAILARAREQREASHANKLQALQTDKPQALQTDQPQALQTNKSQALQTGLPGAARVEEELRRRHGGGAALAVVSLDADDLAAFSAHYGQARGDAAVALIAQVLGRAVDETAGPDGFVGHRGGGDFLVLVPAHLAEDFARRVVAGFDMRIPSLYDAEDAAAGAIEVTDRDGRRRRVPVMTLSLGLAPAGGPGTDPAGAIAEADRWRAVARRDRRSTWAGGPSATP